MPKTHVVLRSDGFDQAVAHGAAPGLYAADAISVVQVNIGLRCNLTCRHCHVNSSPRRKERMDWSTMEAVMAFARNAGATIVDITGGAPEMHPEFRRFVEALRKQEFDVMVRTNLTILLEPGFDDLPEFFRRHRVKLVASLPCYLESNVDGQRGEGVYQASIDALRRLNAAGYGIDPELPLDLVYNPFGPELPPNQATLEEDYRRELRRRFDVRFTRLLTITNVPIGRFRGSLRRAKQEDAYLELLCDNHNAATVPHLMCRHQVSVRWDGMLFDCDFNLAANRGLVSGLPRAIRDATPADLNCRRIATADYCYACTAGAGSACGGALV